MENNDLPSQLKVSKYAEARIKEIKALTQALGESYINIFNPHL